MRSCEEVISPLPFSLLSILFPSSWQSTSFSCFLLSYQPCSVSPTGKSVFPLLFFSSSSASSTFTFYYFFPFSHLFFSPLPHDTKCVLQPKAMLAVRQLLIIKMVTKITQYHEVPNTALIAGLFTHQCNFFKKYITAQFQAYLGLLSGLQNNSFYLHMAQFCKCFKSIV